MFRLWFLYLLSKVYRRLIFRLVFDFWPTTKIGMKPPSEVEQEAVDGVLTALATVARSAEAEGIRAFSNVDADVAKAKMDTPRQFKKGFRILRAYWNEQQRLSTKRFQEFWFAHDLAREQGFSIRTTNKSKPSVHLYAEIVRTESEAPIRVQPI